MLNRLLTSLYGRWGVRSLSVKLLLPTLALSLVCLIGTSVVFFEATRLTRGRLMRQQTEEAFNHVLRALNQREEAVSDAGSLLASDPDLVDALQQETDAALSLLNARAVTIRDHLDLAFVQIYDQHDVLLANSMLSDIVFPGVVAPPLLELAEPGTPVVRAVGNRLLLIRRFPIEENAGMVVVGIDIKTELERIVILEGVTSDLELIVRGVRVGAYATGSKAWTGPAWDRPAQDEPDAADGWGNDHYYQNRSITLGASPARLLLMHPTEDIGRVTNLGLIVTVGGMLLTVLLLTVLNGMVIRSVGCQVASLSRAAKRLARGKLHTPVRLTPHPLTIGENDELGLLAESFKQMADGFRDLCADLEAEVEALRAELTTVAEIAQSVSSSSDSRAILRESARILSMRLKAICPGFHHVSIYLVEQGPRATVLREVAVGPDGHRDRADVWVPLGTRSPVGLAASSRRPEVVQNVRVASAHLKPPLLLDTASAAAVPLLIGDRLIGALSVESKQPNAFGAGALTLLATAADQIARGLHQTGLDEAQAGATERRVDRDRTGFQ